jgi:potassium-transporting ATPase ATP-binding subunit
VLAKQKFNLRERDIAALGAAFVAFSAHTRMSGVNFDEREIRKGAADAIGSWVQTNGGAFPAGVTDAVERVARPSSRNSPAANANPPRPASG